MSTALLSPERTGERQASLGGRVAHRSWLAAAVAALILVAVASVTFGTREVAWSDVVAALTGSGDSLAETAVTRRIPRTVMAMLVGASLGVAGAVMQGITRNPLADPGLLGVTSGASLAVVIGIAFFSLTAPTSIAWVAIGGAGVSAVMVYVVGSLGRGGATPLKLALAGAAVGAAFSSLISAVMLPRIQAMDSFRFWQIGGVGGAGLERAAQVLPFLVVGAVLCLACASGLDSLALGDEVAAGLGENVLQMRIVAATGAVLLCGAATAAAGPIGFVGLVVPHACRLLAGPAHRRLLPLSAVVGAVLLTGADVLGRVVARPDEIDVGIITALVGAPVFVAIVRTQKARAL